jgi:hypothetical protein
MKIPSDVWVNIVWALIGHFCSRLFGVMRICCFTALAGAIVIVAKRDAHFAGGEWLRDVTALAVLIWKLGRWVKILFL